MNAKKYFTMHFSEASNHAWYKMQRIRPSWAVSAFSVFAISIIKVQDDADK